MDNGSDSQGVGGRFGPPSGVNINMMGKQNDDQPQRIQYSMPGILHFLQTEWSRFEMERAQWEVERAELQARIAFLQGERKGQENLKRDLVRRIKMLEFALRKERQKFNNLKYGSDTCPPEAKDNEDKKEEDAMELEPPPANSGTTWRQGRQLLRQYLQEIGYTDTIIDVRSARVRSFLGLMPVGEGDESGKILNGENNAISGDDNSTRTGSNKQSESLSENALRASEQAVLATLDFLKDQVPDDDDDEQNLSDEGEGQESGNKDDSGGEEGEEDMITDSETKDALAEFDFLVSEGADSTTAGDLPGEEEGGGEEWNRGMDQQMLKRLRTQVREENLQRKGRKNLQRPKREQMDQLMHILQDSGESGEEGDKEGQAVSAGMEDESLEAALGLGELAELTVANDAESTVYDSVATDSVKKTWSAKYTLRSHFDSVRGVAFHPVEPVLITASEDHTLKMWNLQKTLPAKKAFSLDVEPVYTFRGHEGPALCVAVNATGEQCFSGGLDSTIRVWNLPNSNIDPYDSYVPSVVGGVYTGHSNAVWDIAVHTSRMQLLSCSADGSMKLWSSLERAREDPLISSFGFTDERGLPTSVDFLASEPNQFVAAFSTGNVFVVDSENGKPICKFDLPEEAQANGRANCVVSHPTLPLVITAHDDRQIRFHDVNSGKTVHSMVAHLDAVTSLAVDPNGLYLLSGSHDSSIRLWNLDNKSCIQEITSHRKKFDESIHDVAFHPAKPYIASAGADALAKVFV